MFKLLILELDSSRDTFTLVGIEILGFRMGIEFSMNADRMLSQSDI